MNKLLPFKGLRYNPQKVQDLAAVVAPPYDVIDSELKSKLDARSPYNVAHIDLPAESKTQDRYQVAGDRFFEWKRTGVLLQESEASLYLYFQTYSLPEGGRLTRKGFFIRRRLEGFAEGGIKPHEKTFAGPKQDRYRLMERTHAQLSPIFALYSDPQKNSAAQLQKWSTSSAPIIEIVQENGDEHRVWKVDDVAAIAEFLASIENSPLLIADGHHRYETALNYCMDRKAELKGAFTGKENFNYVLMYLCSLEDPGLVILPTHRVLNERLAQDAASFRPLLEKIANLKTFPDSQLEQARQYLRQEGEDGHAIAWVHDGLIEVICFDEKKALESASLSHLDFAVRDLDVTLLHDLILAELMGISKEAQREYGKIKYIQDPQEVVRLAKEKNTFGFLLNPTKIQQVQAITEVGETMPQKSTFFYPKLLTGLIFYEL